LLIAAMFVSVIDEAQRFRSARHVGIRCTTPVWLARPDGRMIAG
jgi:hypothetical protein